MTDWCVNLDIYNGPMDLLLYLIKRDEVDIHDIPIAHITGQFVDYVDTLRELDPDMAGEFLVLATMLMEIKTRMLLPRPEALDDDDEMMDPRADLVRQLLEYKAFKDAAGDLRSAAAEQALRFPRRPTAPIEDDGTDLEDVQLWDLVEAFNKLLADIGQDADRQSEIIYDDTPIELYADDIMDRLTREGNLTFTQIFTGRTQRMELVGLFLATLELTKRRQILIEQNKPFEEIYITLNPNAPTPEELAAEAARDFTKPDEPGPADEATAPSEEPAETTQTPEAPVAPDDAPAAEEAEEAAEAAKAERIFAVEGLHDMEKIARIDDLTDLEGLDGPGQPDDRDGEAPADDDDGEDPPRTES